MDSEKLDVVFYVCLLVGIVVAVFFLGQLSMQDLNNPVQNYSDLNTVLVDLDDLKIGVGVVLANQQVISNALVLNELGASGCVVSNSFQVDVNTVGISLLCPIQGVQE